MRSTLDLTDNNREGRAVRSCLNFYRYTEYNLSKNIHAKNAIVKGLINQLTTMVNNSPLGFFPISLTELKSIWTIIGKIINQTNTATGIFTVAIFISLRIVIEFPKIFPRTIPPII